MKMLVAQIEVSVDNGVKRASQILIRKGADPALDRQSLEAVFCLAWSDPSIQA